MKIEFFQTFAYAGPNPVLVAEEYAMLDNLLEGRLRVAMLRGTPNDYLTYFDNPWPAYDALAEEFRVVMVELPGWGSQPNDVADLDGLADQVAEIVSHIGLDTFHLLGTSLGGACALHLATRHPERVISLTLESPA